MKPFDDGTAGDWSRLVGTGGDPDPDSRERAAEPGTGLEARGAFRLIACLGAGGFGEVWRAEQTEPVARAVAVKLIRRGLASAGVLARFGAERRALARMAHPNVARVYDAGVAGDGRPFFAMELVEGGVPITAYCDAHALDLRARLELFLPVCAALHHAHQKGLIHRDVKPANVLVGVTDGIPVPKVIDFGVAKALGDPWDVGPQLTAVGEVVGTPAYMSPEQARAGGDVDVRSDVYGLGALLYDLLVGSPPFVTVPGTRWSGRGEAVGASEVPAPGTRFAAEPPDMRAALAAWRGTDPIGLARALRGELEWIVMRALAPVQAARYAGSEALAADVRRHLADEPVAAAPPSLRYRARKWGRRNRRRVAALGVIIAVLVYAGAELRAAARGRFVDRDVPARAHEAWALPYEERAPRLEHLRAELDDRNPSERELALTLDLRSALARQLAGEDALARDRLTALIAVLEREPVPNLWARAGRHLLLRMAYTGRAAAHEGLARRALPLETALAADRMPDRATVAAGAADFARSYADMDRVLRLRAGRDWVLGSGDTEDASAAAATARGYVLARTRFYLVKGLLERGHWEEAREVAGILDGCATLPTGEGHYDVACAFAVAYGRSGRADDAELAVKHLRAAHKLGFGTDPVQAAMGTIRGSLKGHLGVDPDVNALRNHPAFVAFVKELDAKAAPR